MVRVLIALTALFMASASQAFTVAPRATSFTTVSTSTCSLFSTPFNAAHAVTMLSLQATYLTQFKSSPRATLSNIGLQAMHSPTVRFGLLTEQESAEIMAKSLECADGECSIEDVENLLSDLKEQQKVLTGRLAEVTQMISSLYGVNKDDERKVDEVRETVRAIARLFLMGDKASGNDYPALSKPTGWTGDVGKGATTAYDALPPKKRKNPSP
jgi:hypothetical protein